MEAFVDTWGWLVLRGVTRDLIEALPEEFCTLLCLYIGTVVISDSDSFYFLGWNVTVVKIWS